MCAGNGYLRMLFLQAARVILLRPKNWSKHGFGAWFVRAAQRLAKRTDVLSPRMVRIISDLASDWRQLDERN
jgi:hypothetical protein